MTEKLNLYNQLETITNKKEFAQQMLWQICKLHDACQGAFYEVRDNKLVFMEGYAFPVVEEDAATLPANEGLTGQVVKDGRYLNLSEVPEGYLTVFSGLGKSSPTNLLIYPFKNGNHVIASLEIAAFKSFENKLIELLDQLNPLVSQKIA